MQGYKSVRSQSIHINSLSCKLANLALQFSRPLIVPLLGQTVAMSTLPSPQNPITRQHSGHFTMPHPTRLYVPSFVECVQGSVNPCIACNDSSQTFPTAIYSFLNRPTPICH